jgi:hypothetical protein
MCKSALRSNGCQRGLVLALACLGPAGLGLLPVYAESAQSDSQTAGHTLQPTRDSVGIVPATCGPPLQIELPALGVHLSIPCDEDGPEAGAISHGLLEYRLAKARRW